MMDRRLFLLSAAGAATSPQGGGYEAAPVAAASADPVFATWLAGFVERARAKGWTDAQLGAAFAGLSADPRVLAADSRQPELVKPVSAYVASTASDARVEEGQARRAENTVVLARASALGAPAEILVAIWGVESSYGRIQGSMDVVRSLATIAAEGRRKAFAEDQLYAALRILASGEAGREQLRGSWAGAMGQTQFTPQDYLDFAVDGDGDGRRDIWGSSADALASTANFLGRKAAWRGGEGWMREVVLPPGFDYGLAEGPKQPWAAWEALGMRTANGLGWRAADAAEASQLSLPAGWTGPALLLLPNHFAIRAYNNSLSYALGVGYLAHRIAGGAPLVRPWPAEEPLSRAERLGAQLALQRLGYDVGEPDGVLGAKTRQAARQWQRTRDLPADGYLTAALIAQLTAQAGIGPADIPPPAPSPVAWLEPHRPALERAGAMR